MQDPEQRAILQAESDHMRTEVLRVEYNGFCFKTLSFTESFYSWVNGKSKAVFKSYVMGTMIDKLGLEPVVKSAW